MVAIVDRGIFTIRYDRSGGSRCVSMRSGGGVTCRLLACRGPCSLVAMVVVVRILVNILVVVVVVVVVAAL